jgi:hypothetical protein
MGVSSISSLKSLREGVCTTFGVLTLVLGFPPTPVLGLGDFTGTGEFGFRAGCTVTFSTEAFAPIEGAGECLLSTFFSRLNAFSSAELVKGHFPILPASFPASKDSIDTGTACLSGECVPFCRNFSLTCLQMVFNSPSRELEARALEAEIGFTGQRAAFDTIPRS